MQLKSNMQNDNHLGLLAVKNQSKGFRVFDLFTLNKKLWSCDAPSKRIEFMRDAYESLYGHKDECINQLLEDMSTKQLEQSIHNNAAHIQDARKCLDKKEAVQTLFDGIEAISKQEMMSFQQTFNAAKESREGFVRNRKGRNSNLTAIINIFSKLYKNKSHNPMLQSPVSFEGLADAKKQRAAVLASIEHIQEAILTLMKMSQGEFDMVFSDDDVKHPAIVRQLKLHFNRLALECDYGFRFENIKKEQARRNLAQSRAIWNRIWQTRYNKLRSVFGYQALNDEFIDEQYRDVKPELDADGSPLVYKLSPFNVNDHANEKRGWKQSLRKWMNVMLPVVMIAAVVVAVGQMAIAVAAMSGTMAVFIGLASFTANFFLFNRDMKDFFVNLFKGKLFEDLSLLSKTLLSSFFVLSLATGIMSGGLVFRMLLEIVLPQLLPAIGLASLATPAGLVALATITSIVTVAGMTSLYFMVGANIAQQFKGRYFLTHNITFSDGSVKEVKGLLAEWRDNFSDFMSYPRNADNKIIYNKNVALLKEKRNAAVSESDRKFYQRQLSVAKVAFKARHVLKCFFTTVFMPIAVVCAAIYTFALMKSSFPGTQNLIKVSLKVADAVALSLTVLITIGASIVNASLNTKNLMGAADVFGAKLGKVVAGLVFGIVNLGHLIVHPSRLWLAMKDGFNDFKESPSKSVFPALLHAVKAALTALVLLNGYGNAKELALEGAISVPSASPVGGQDLTFWASMFGSDAMNYIASVIDTFEDWTPYKRLESQSSYKKVTGELGGSDGTASSAEPDSKSKSKDSLDSSKDSSSKGAAEKLNLAGDIGLTNDVKKTALKM